MKKVDELERNPSENAVVPVETPPTLQNPAEMYPVFTPVYNTQ